jgi:two-component system heavy metal sensor histidine kinase CusS
MFLRPPKSRSIASQLVLVFTIAAVSLIACGLGTFYWLVVRHTFAEDKSALDDKAAALRVDVRQLGPAKTAESEIKSIRRGEHRIYWLRLLDSTGQTIVETPDMSRSLPPAVFPTAAEAGQPSNRRVGRDLFSLVTEMSQSNGNQYVIQLAQDRSADEKFNREVGLLFFVMLGLSLLASILIARITTSRGLKPLVEMTAALERIGPTRLSERVAPASWPHELQPLAEAFDKMLNRLEDSFTRLSQFSADLAHELRTPIANILGEAQVALTRPRTLDEYRGVIESNVAECERLSRLVDNLLFLARAESAREQIKLTQLDGRAAVEKIASFYRTIADDRNIKIDCEGEGNIHADPLLFTRAISNLVDNALRFTPDGGNVRISISNRDNETEVSVTDTGCGIASEHLGRVFDRFYRVDPSRSSSGAGLGLALVKSIVELHGGSATVDSRISLGTTVILRFPNSVPRGIIRIPSKKVQPFDLK